MKYKRFHRSLIEEKLYFLIEENKKLKESELELKDLSKAYEKLRKKNIYIKFSDEFVNDVCELAAEEKLGARPLDRIIRSNIEDKICECFFSNSFESKVFFEFYVEDGISIKASHGH